MKTAHTSLLDIHADGPLVTITAFGGWAVEPMPVFNEIPEIVYLDQPIGNLTLRDGGDYRARDRAVKGRVVGALEGEAAAGGHPSSDCSGSDVDRTFFQLAALTAYAGEGRWNPTTFQLWTCIAPCCRPIGASHQALSAPTIGRCASTMAGPVG